nr:iron uptake protein [uncultured Duganella sp.]
MPRAAFTALRVLGAVGGGYALTALTVAVGAVALSRAGMVRSEAVALAAMLGFVLYLALLLWGFSVRHVGRMWLAFGAGAAVMWALWRSLA